MERESVVDRIDRSLAEEAVPALAIGVVREQIEEADLLQALVVRGILTQREIMLLEVRRHELLQRAVAEGAFALDRPRHQCPAECFRKQVRGDLTTVDRRRKVPERALAAARLVDGLASRTVQRELDEERRVGAPRHPALDRDLAVAKQVELTLSGRRGRCSAGRRGPWGLWAAGTWDRGAVLP